MEVSKNFSELGSCRGKSMQQIKFAPMNNLRLNSRLSGRPLINQVHKSLKNLKISPALPVLPNYPDFKSKQEKPSLLQVLLTPNSDRRHFYNSQVEICLKKSEKEKERKSFGQHDSSLAYGGKNEIATPTFYNGFFNRNEIQDNQKLRNTKNSFNKKFRVSMDMPVISMSCKKIPAMNKVLSPKHNGSGKIPISLSHKKIKVLSHRLAKDVFTVNPGKVL